MHDPTIYLIWPPRSTSNVYRYKYGYRLPLNIHSHKSPWLSRLERHSSKPEVVGSNPAVGKNFSYFYASFTCEKKIWNEFMFHTYLWNSVCVLHPLAKGVWNIKTRDSFHKYRMKWKLISDSLFTGWNKFKIIIDWRHYFWEHLYLKFEFDQNRNFLGYNTIHFGMNMLGIIYWTAKETLQNIDAICFIVKKRKIQTVVHKLNVEFVKRQCIHKIRISDKRHYYTSD